MLGKEREAKVEAWFNEQIKALDPEADCHKNRDDRGFPDRTYYMDFGLTILVEFKRDGEGLRPLQRRRIERLRCRGHSVYVAIGRKGAEEVFESVRKMYYELRAKGRRAGGRS